MHAPHTVSACIQYVVCTVHDVHHFRMEVIGWGGMECRRTACSLELSDLMFHCWRLFRREVKYERRQMEGVAHCCDLICLRWRQCLQVLTTFQEDFQDGRGLFILVFRWICDLKTSHTSVVWAQWASEKQNFKFTFLLYTCSNDEKFIFRRSLGSFTV